MDGLLLILASVTRSVRLTLVRPVGWSLRSTYRHGVTLCPSSRPISGPGTYAHKMMIPVLALVATLLLPVHAASVDGCADVHIIGARGSGQTGYGDQVGAVVSESAAKIRQTGRTVDTHSLDYPAISISDSFGLVLLNGDYARSVAAGAAALRADLDTLRERCPQTPIILVGYSQGSQAIKQALADRPPIDRISSVVLLADPTRDITQLGVMRIGADAEGSGAFGSVMLPEHLRTVALDVCAVGDGVCGVGSFLAHIDGYESLAGPIAGQILGELVPTRSGFLRPS